MKGLKICNFHRDRQKCFPWKSLFYGLNHIANKARTDEAADNGRSRIQDRLTSSLQSDQSVMCSCSFAKEKPTKRGLYSFIDYFVHSIWKLFFFSTEDTILIFEACGIKSDCWPQRLKCKMAVILNPLDCNIFWVYTCSLIFRTSLWQCRVNVGCICWIWRACWINGKWKRKGGVNREIKIHIYRKHQTSDSSWEFFRIENKQIETVTNDSMVKTSRKLLIFL